MKPEHRTHTPPSINCAFVKWLVSLRMHWLMSQSRGDVIFCHWQAAWQCLKMFHTKTFRRPKAYRFQINILIIMYFITYLNYANSRTHRLQTHTIQTYFESNRIWLNVADNCVVPVSKHKYYTFSSPRENYTHLLHLGTLFRSWSLYPWAWLHPWCWSVFWRFGVKW